jgi:hypothetical protein
MVTSRLAEARTPAQQEAAKILSEALNGDRLAQNKLVEGISTSDFPVQLTPALNQIVLNNYAEQPKIWQNWASREVFTDFRESEYMQFTWDHEDEDIPGSNSGFTHTPGGLPVIPEYGEYPVIRFEATGQGLKIHKNGVQIKLSWESIVNDRNFGLLRRIPGEFGRRAATQEDVEATRPLLSTTNFSAGNGNLVTGSDWALSINSVEAAFEYIAQQTYNGNRVVPATNYKLVIPASLEMTARYIQNITRVERVDGVGTASEVRYESGNPVGSKFDIVVNPYLTQLGAQDDQWWLIPTPGSTPNPAVINGFLAGHEAPEIFVQKTTTGDPVEGAFIDDSYSTKVRHVVTGGFIRPEATLKADPTP